VVPSKGHGPDLTRGKGKGKKSCRLAVGEGAYCPHKKGGGRNNRKEGGGENAFLIPCKKAGARKEREITNNNLL